MKPISPKIELLKGYYNFVLEMIEINKSLLKDHDKLIPIKYKLGETFIKDYIRCLEATKNITNDLLKSLHEFNNLDIDKESLWKSLLKTQTKQEKN